jgi:thioredoxin-dependent peroxiredoxin
MKTLCLVAALGLALSCAAARAAELKPGDAAPEFSLVGSDGKTHRLSDYKGKQAVVLAWFPKAFTGGWTKECKSLRESGDKIREFDVAYFAASTDTAQKNKEFAESLEADFPILGDPDKQAAEPYGVLMPVVGLAKRWTFYVGKDGKVLFVDKDVKVDTAGADIAAKLAELGVARKR